MFLFLNLQAIIPRCFNLQAVKGMILCKMIFPLTFDQEYSHSLGENKSSVLNCFFQSSTKSQIAIENQIPGRYTSQPCFFTRGWLAKFLQKGWWFSILQDWCCRFPQEHGQVALGYPLKVAMSHMLNLNVYSTLHLNAIELISNPSGP